METNHDELNRILGKLLAEVEGINNRLDRVNGRLDKHDDKVNTLESFQDNATGRMTIIGAVTAFAVGILGSWVNRMFN